MVDTVFGNIGCRNQSKDVTASITLPFGASSSVTIIHIIVSNLRLHLSTVLQEL